MEVFQSWMADLPQQFKEKEKIEVLIRAFSRQLEELYAVFRALDMETDMDTAVGKNLDMVGDIVNLSRKDAHIILRTAKTAEIDDEIYRKVLKYKNSKNNCDCTYYDIMDSMSLLWNTDSIKYVEDPAVPATIFLTFPEFDMETDDPTVERILAIKPSGVAMIYTVKYLSELSLEEKMEFSKITMRFDFPFWGNWWVLDGSVLLDGSHYLNSVRQAIHVGLRFNQIFVKNAETIQIMYATGFLTVINERMIHSNIRLSNVIKGREDMRLSCSTLFTSKSPENFESTEVRCRQDYWLLDGSVLLDGSKILNANEYKEDL